jgi:hypothetical protein
VEERPRGRSDERGPLSDEGYGEETRRVPLSGSSEPGYEARREDESTRHLTPEEAAERRSAPRRVSRMEGGGASRREEAETRIIRPEGGARGRETEAVPYPRGYLEAAEQRQARLREVYGGVDWLASFIGCIIAIVAAGFLALIAGLILAPLGYSLNLGGPQLDTAAIVGLVAVGLVLFFAYLFGGYVAGRLARFDGGRNGAMTVVWGILLTVLLAGASFILGTQVFGNLQQTVTSSVNPAVGNLAQAGLVGLGIAAGALLLELLGGFLGGRMGSRYHTKIDRTT